MNPFPLSSPLRTQPQDGGEVCVLPATTWIEHFRANVRRDWQIPWQTPDRLSPVTAARIGQSIAHFQRGESSEGKDYLSKSQRFAAAAGDPTFHDASILFVREENAHAALLIRFMRQNGIAARASVFSDRVFRRLRAPGDLGWSSRVLLVAELIAQEYYPCLRVATGHPVLVRICDKIICDEDAHIQFQVERIARLEATLGLGLRRVRDALQCVLMAGTACVVYLGHRPVITMRMGFWTFLRRSVARNGNAIERMRDASGLHTANRLNPRNSTGSCV